MGAIVAKILFKNKYENLTQIPKSFFELNFNDIDGNNVEFSSKKGKFRAFLVTNVATKWGLTNQNYTELVELYKKYNDQGLEILGFPSNQFRNQEPGSEADIKAYANRFGVTFPMFSKIFVNGPDTHPIFKYLRANSSLFCKKTKKMKEVPWNFAKFLLDRDGNVKFFYSPNLPPSKLESSIQELLK